MDRDKRLWGFNFEYELGSFDLQGQVISADEGADLDRVGWWIEPSVHIDLPGFHALGADWLTGFRPLFRYGTLRNDFSATIDNSLTWNRKATTIAGILDVTDSVRLMIEQTWNVEEPHRFGVRNNELLIHLRLDW